jgi:hypothetical protein
VKKDADAANPLVYDGQKLVPSVTRVFSASKDLFVFLQAYDRTDASPQPLVAFVSFYRGETKAFETAPLAQAEPADSRTKAIPLRFAVPLQNLPPGQYDCQVSVLNAGAQKVAFWRASIVVVP